MQTATRNVFVPHSISYRMSDRISAYRAKRLSTNYPQWRNLPSCVALVVLSTGAVLSWWYAYFTLPETGCHKGVLYFSVFWLGILWVVIGFLFRYRDIPAFARTAIQLLILLSNVWFGLFIFSLEPCAS